MSVTNPELPTARSLGRFLLLLETTEAFKTLSILVGEMAGGSCIVAGGTDMLVRLAGALKREREREREERENKKIKEKSIFHPFRSSYTSGEGVGMGHIP